MKESSDGPYFMYVELMELMVAQLLQFKLVCFFEKDMIIFQVVQEYPECLLYDGPLSFSKTRREEVEVIELLEFRSL